MPSSEKRPRKVRKLDPDGVSRAYAKLSGCYDLLFERVFDGGRQRLFRFLPTGRPLSVLEVGVGTGLSFPYYAPDWRIVGVDFSPEMLRRARERLANEPPGDSVSLLQMDASRMAFADGAFDAAVAAYVISATSDPAGVLREMVRVVKPGGWILLLNHFLAETPPLAWIERRISPWCVPIGFCTDLEMAPLLAAVGLTPDRVDRVNLFGMWRLVVCRVGAKSNVQP